jgi:hypothetical protein
MSTKQHLFLYVTGFLTLIFCVSFPVFVYGEEEVNIQTAGNQSEVLLRPDKPSPANESKIDRLVERAENKTADVLKAPTDVIGKGTDKTVSGVQKVGDKSLGRLFRLIDFPKNKPENEQ